MYVLIHLLGQKLNMCSHRFIASGRYIGLLVYLLLLIVLQTSPFLLIRMPNYCACAHTDRLDQFTNLYFGFSFRSGSSGLAGQFQVVEREFSTRRGRRAPLPETVRTGNLKLQPTIPDHTLHDMTCRPVFCTAVQSSSSTTCDFYSCIPIRLLRWHIRSRTSHVLDGRKG